MANPTDRTPTAFNQPGDSLNFPRLGPKRSPDQATQAVISKLVTTQDRQRTTNVAANRGLTPPDMALLQKISDTTATNVMDAASLFQLLPDTELAMQILVSSTLSPKDMGKVELNYTVDQSSFSGPVAGSLLEKVSDYFENVYKINDLLPKMLQDGLFYTGSYPLMILPENSIDDAINSPARVSLESIRDEVQPDGRVMPIGLLGNPQAPVTAFGFESMFQSASSARNYAPDVPRQKDFEMYLSVTDNPSVLKMPILKDKIQQDRVQDVLASRKISMEVRRESISVESGGSTSQADTSLYRKRRYKNVPVLAMTPANGLKRSTIGHPLVMKLPSECVIPVHMPSNPEEHLGYFVLLDTQGNPLVHSQVSDYYADLSANIANNKEMVSQLIATTKRMETGRELNHKEDIDELARIYGDLVEEDLVNRLKHGVYGDNVAVSKPQDVYRIMLSRALAKMHTQALYVPRELMTYVAFDYNEYGIGTSLIQNSKIIGGIRAMLLFANTMAAIKNSVGRTGLNITLDPNDPDPSKTVEFLFHEYAKNRQGSYPIGANNPRDIVDFLQNAGVEIAVSGNTAYPETKLEVESKQSNVTKPDQDLETSLRERHLMGLGLTPETVDAGAHAEFATSIVQNNLLLSKRVMLYQKILTSFVADFIQKYILNSSYLMDALRQIILENFEQLTKEQKDDAKGAVRKAQKSGAPGAEVVDQPAMEATPKEATSEHRPGVDAILMQFINAIEVSLPSPDTSTLENQMKAFDQYVEALDKAIQAYIDASFMDSSSMGELSEAIDSTKATIKAHYIRQWLRNNNVLSELDQLTTYTDDGQPALNLLETSEAHIEALSKSIEAYMKGLLQAKAKRDERMNKVKAALEPEQPTEPTPPENGDGGDAGDTGGDGSDLDAAGDTGGGDDLGDLDSIDAAGDGAGDETETADDAGDSLDMDAALGDTASATDSKDTSAEPAAKTEATPVDEPAAEPQAKVAEAKADEPVKDEAKPAPEPKVEEPKETEEPVKDEPVKPEPEAKAEPEPKKPEPVSKDEPGESDDDQHAALEMPGELKGDGEKSKDDKDTSDKDEEDDLDLDKHLAKHTGFKAFPK